MQKAADEHPQARLLMTQPGVGPNTALAFVLTIGDVSRFGRVPKTMWVPGAQDNVGAPVIRALCE